jgi:hypothetical protein
VTRIKTRIKIVTPMNKKTKKISGGTVLVQKREENGLALEENFVYFRLPVNTLKHAHTVFFILGHSDYGCSIVSASSLDPVHYSHHGNGVYG